MCCWVVFFARSCRNKSGWNTLLPNNDRRPSDSSKLAWWCWGKGMVGDGGSSLKYFRTCPFEGTVYATLPKNFPYFKIRVSTRMTSLTSFTWTTTSTVFCDSLLTFYTWVFFSVLATAQKKSPVKPGNIFVPKGHADGLFHETTPSNGWTCGGFGPEGGHCKFKVTKDPWS